MDVIHRFYCKDLVIQTNKVNYHKSVVIFHHLIAIYVYGAQKNRLNETVLLCTINSTLIITHKRKKVPSNLVIKNRD